MAIKVKVTMVAPNPPWFPGGIERHVGELMKGLKSKVELDLYCTTSEDSDLSIRNWESIPVNTFKATGSAYHFSASLRQALKKNCDSDIIHAHGFTTYAPNAASKVSGGRTFVFTTHFHALGSSPYYRLARRFYDPMIGAGILKKADNIICVSENEKKGLIGKFPFVENKISIIPNGIPLNNIQNAKPFKLDHRSILYIGRMERYKNIDIAIKSMEKIPGDIHLYLIGIGPERENLIRLSKALHFNRRIHFLENISDKELYRWLKTCDLVINFSDIEAFGITVIEALAAGKPVLVNDAMSLGQFALNYPEAVSALDVHNSSCGQIADLMKKVIKQSIESNGSKIDVREFDWSNICKSTFAIYRKERE